MDERWVAEARSSYDADAEGYADVVRGLLERTPALRACLGLFAELVERSGGGPVADVGCGPGYVTRYLADLGVEAFGVDLSPEMVAVARRDHPDLRFEVGSMTDLDLGDGSVGGVLAFWSVIHVPDAAVPGVVAEFRRVLRPGAPLLVGFHVGEGTHRTTTGHGGGRIGVDSHRRPVGQVSGWLREAGFGLDVEVLLRPDDEVPGAVVIAHGPA